MKKYITSERPNLFEPNVYITMVVKLTGKVTPEMAERAVNAAYSANESTMSRIVLSENSDAYYERTEESGCKVIHDRRDPKAIINESEKRTFDIKDGELIRTFIIPNSDGITLLIHAHHLAGDGKSILIFVNDVLDSLDGQTPQFKPMILLDGEYLTSRAKLPSGVKMWVRHINRKWAKTGRIFGWDDYYAIHRKYWSAHSSDFEIRSYGVNELKNRCIKGTTLNSLLILDLLKSRPESRVVGIPVSIREGNYSMSNQTSGIAVTYQYNKNKSFEQNLKCLHTRIYKKLNNRNLRYFVLLFVTSLFPSLIDSVLLQTHGCYSSPLSGKMADIMGYTDKNSRDIGITNLTNIEISADYAGFEVSDILFIPPKISYSKEVVGVATYRDRLTVCRNNVN